MDIQNTIYTNDNLLVLNGMDSESVDLIYLDPPFNSKRLCAAPEGSRAAGAAFKDIWTWDDVDADGFADMAREYECLPRFIALIETLHGRAMKAYMALRLRQLHRVLKGNGSLYLHCDPTASHYLKLGLDMIFGRDTFRNEIIWSYQTGGVSRRWFGRKHDVILLYPKTDDYYIDLESVKEKRSDEVLRRMASGVKNATRADTPERLPFDVWTIPALNAMSSERTGYPTQKPLALLERIIKASSREGDVVLDPFCGCATTCVAAHRSNRKWIGIDVEEKSVALLEQRLTAKTSEE